MVKVAHTERSGSNNWRRCGASDTGCVNNLVRTQWLALPTDGR